MIPLKTILCPVDLSGVSAHALFHAVALARWYGSSLTVLHVYEQTLPTMAFSEFPGAPALTPPPDPSNLENAVRTLAEPAFRAGIDTRVAVVPGRPVTEILREGGRADLLVLGTHGRGGFERLVLGSVAEKVLRKAACPVLTVPPSSTGTTTATFKRILCPIDFSSASMKGLDFAFSLAREADARVTLLHVVEGLPENVPPELADYTLPDYLVHRQEEARQRLKAAIPADASNWCEPEEVVLSGSPSREILRAAEEGRADLIVIGVQGRNAVDLMIFGSTTAHVTRQAACPVLTVREK